ncbi:MAG: hypothetical protein QNK37_30310 [Acidobacteriota bacterium]|nr:hypothetical protein [Acidobacteriota bacterium]
MTNHDIRGVLGYSRNRTLQFSEFVEEFIANPEGYLHTSPTLLASAIKHFGFKIVVRSGEPVISYDIFKDEFNNGTNAVFGQEFAIKHLVDSITSAGKEAGPNRGLVLIGPPASGKTNIIDLMSHALEEYSKQKSVKLYSFFFEFKSEDGLRTLEFWSPFRHNPVLLFPVVLAGDQPLRPRQELFEWACAGRDHKVSIPTYYQNASLDKNSINIIEGLLQNPRNRGKSLFNIFEDYVRIEEIVFSAGQAQGISNIDDMRELKIRRRNLDIGPEDKAILNYHLPGFTVYLYEGAMVASNRGILHIHDGFSGDDRTSESDYRPLLMLLGSGKASVDATQASIDTSVIVTTNIEEMERLEGRLTSSKLLDRIEKVPVNYLLDANSEMDILKRDMAIMREEYEVDPNLLRVAANYAVLTRLLPPGRKKFPENWSQRKRDLYLRISPEQKLFIYAYQSEEPIHTIQKIPHWHGFRNEAMKLGLDLNDPDQLTPLIERHPESITLHASGLFTNDELSLIDDAFMRELWKEHYPFEGRTGISVRQLQNIMRNTVSHSDGRKIHVGTFLSQLKRMIREGPELHHWLHVDGRYKKDGPPPARVRKIGEMQLGPGEGSYGDFSGLVKVVQYLYYKTIEREITEATVDRDPVQIETDLRRYLQYALLANAIDNKAFAHIMVPKFTFIHPTTGEKVDKPDTAFMASIEKAVAPNRDPVQYRREIAQKFLEMQSKGEISIAEGKNVLNSRNDNLLVCFHTLYAKLLSHRRTVEGINAELLRDAFFQRKNNLTQYKTYPVEIRGLVENIINNMKARFNYPETIALDTIVFALRKKIVDITKMIN